MIVRSVSARALAPALAAALLAATAASAAVALTLLAGTKSGIALATIAVGGPAFAYLAIVAPAIFPFGSYAALVPFDNLLDVAAFGTLTKILGILTGVAFLAFMLRTRRAVSPPKALFIWSALVVWLAATAFWAIDQQSVFALLPTACELVVLFAAVSVFPSDRKAVSACVIATVAGGVAAALYGAYLFHSGIDIAARSNRLWIMTDSSEIDPNHFAAALLLPISLCAGTALYTRRVVPAVGATAALAIMLVGVAESGSRGAAIGIAVMALYLFVRSDRRLRLALGALPAAAGLAILSLHTSIWARFAQTLSSGGSNRLPIWKVGLTTLKSHWLLGAGYNNFGFAYDQAFLQTHQTQFANWHRAPHDLLIGTGVELGIVGVALVIAGWVAQFRMLRNVPATSPEYPLRLALESAVLATFVAALFLDVMIAKYLWLTFMLIALIRNASLRCPS
ncbi:MAG: O-antigen ligase family protein [Candidatus Baltobacteraceae bacterium]